MAAVGSINVLVRATTYENAADGWWILNACWYRPMMEGETVLYMSLTKKQDID